MTIETLSKDLRIAVAALPLPAGDLDDVISRGRRRTRRRRRLGLASLAVSAVALASGALSLNLRDDPPRPVEVSSAPTTAAAAPKFASTPAWQEMGERMAASKKAVLVDPNNPYAPHIGNRDFDAYQSEPVDVVGPGEYTLHFGPLGDEFHYPTSPSGLAFGAPPDVEFDYHNATQGYVTKDGRRYLAIRMIVSPERFRSPYPGFRMWIS